jgi:hypothetical protein
VCPMPLHADVAVGPVCCARTVSVPNTNTCQPFHLLVISHATPLGFFL